MHLVQVLVELGQVALDFSPPNGGAKSEKAVLSFRAGLTSENSLPQRAGNPEQSAGGTTPRFSP